MVSRKAEFQAELADHKITLDHFNAQLEESDFKLSGQYGLTADIPHQLKLTLKQFDLEQLSDMLGPLYPFAGKSDLTLELQTTGTTWQPHDKTCREPLRWQLRICLSMA